MRSFVQQLLNSQAAVYALRVVFGFLIGYYLYLNFPEYEPFWCLLSIILVISPESKDALRLSTERFKSNLIGSFVGLICLQFKEIGLWVLLFGILLTIIICFLFKVMNMARVALVALIIVLIQPHVIQTELAPLFRFGAVAAGCFIGLFVVISSAIVIKQLRLYYQIEDKH